MTKKSIMYRINSLRSDVSFPLPDWGVWQRILWGRELAMLFPANMNCIFFAQYVPPYLTLSFAATSKYRLYPLFCLLLTTTIIPHSNSLSSISSPLNTRSIFFRSGARNTLFSLVGRFSGFFRVQYSLLENRHYESPDPHGFLQHHSPSSPRPPGKLQHALLEKISIIPQKPWYWRLKKWTRN